MDHKKKAALIINIIFIVVSAIWFYRDRDFEPLILLFGFLYNLINSVFIEKDNKLLDIQNESKNSTIKADTIDPIIPNEEKDLLNILKDVGLVGATSRLSATKFEPIECMKQTKKRLLFMGILGSKWVNTPDNEFENFLRRVESKHGEVRFLLINPVGKAYLRLVDLREGNIKEQSLNILNDFSIKYPFLRIKLYDDLPCFRLILMDESIVAVSRYKLDKEGYFESKKGWENPHVVFTADSKWSFYDPFEHYYHNIWDSSQDLKDYIFEQNKGK